MVTSEEIANAMAVHSVDDRTRASGNADETDTVVSGDGALQPADEVHDTSRDELAEHEKKPAQIDE